MLVPALHRCPSHTRYCPPAHSTTCNSLPSTHSVSYNWVFAYAVPSTWSIYSHPCHFIKLHLILRDWAQISLFFQEDLPGRFPCTPTGPPLPTPPPTPVTAHAAFEWPPCISAPSLDCALFQGQRWVPSTQQGAQPRGGAPSMFGKCIHLFSE